MEGRSIGALEYSSSETIESLCEHIAAHVFNHKLDNAQDTVRLRVKIEKPKAMSQAEAPVLGIYRRMDDLDSAHKPLGLLVKENLR